MPGQRNKLDRCYTDKQIEFGRRSVAAMKSRTPSNMIRFEIFSPYPLHGFILLSLAAIRMLDSYYDCYNLFYVSVFRGL